MVEPSFLRNQVPQGVLGFSEGGGQNHLLDLFSSLLA